MPFNNDPIVLIQQGKTRAQRHWTVRLAAMLLVLGWMVCLVSYGLMLNDVETVLASGPTLLIVGILALIFSTIKSYWWGIAIGLAHISLTFVFFFSVFINQWSPRDAELPFAVMGAAYLVAITPATVIAWLKRPSGFASWQCQHCGYPLVGLERPQCPECGHSFDPQTVKSQQGRIIGERHRSP
jgi:hypothetical protein